MGRFRKLDSPQKSMAGSSHVWKQGYFPGDDQAFIQRSHFTATFSALEDNAHLDIFSKRVGLKAAPYVVSVQIYSDDKKNDKKKKKKKMITAGSGFVIECNTSENGCGFKCIILTSTTLLRIHHNRNFLHNNLKVLVIPDDKKEYQGDVVAHNFHYNIAAIAIMVDHPLVTSKLRYIDDLPALESLLHPHSDRFKLVHGTKVLSLGRSCGAHRGLMVAQGLYSTKQCNFDCKELIRSTCRITQCGIGGPVINRNAEVIGVNFFDIDFTPFLPINFASKWWIHYKKTGENCRPWIGAEISNQKNEIVVDEITQNSPAFFANVLTGDIIVEYEGKMVRSALQWYDLIWDSVGKSAKKLIVMRCNSRVELSIRIGNIEDNQFNRWPLPHGVDFWKKYFY